MNEKSPNPDFLRLSDVIAVVLIGVALGVLFNALQLAENPARALAWMKVERTLVALETGAPAVAAATTSDSTPAGTPAPTSATAARPATPDSAARATHPGLVKGARPSVPGKPGAKPVGAVPPPAPSAPASSSPAKVAPVPASALPAVADAREPREVAIDFVRPFHAAGAAIFVDSRSREEYAAGHIAGAICLPFDEVFRDPSLAKSVNAGSRPVITYCDGGDCDLSRNLAFSLIDTGLRKVLVFTGGMPAWKAAGAPVHTGSQP